MYCTQCGKQIDYEALLCDECLGRQMRERANKVALQPLPTVTREEFNPEFEEVADGDVDFGTKVDPGTGYTENYDPEANYFDPYYQKSGGTGDKKFGFKKALFSTILSAVSMYAIVLLFYVFMLSLAGTLAEDLHWSVIVASGLGLLSTIAAAIVCLVFEIQSIKAYKRHSAETGTKPVPTLVLGIIGTATAGEAILAGAIVVFDSLLILTALGLTSF